MEVSDVIARLSEARRKNQVRMLDFGSTNDPGVLETIRDTELLFDVPVFDMGRLFDKQSDSPLFVDHKEIRSDLARSLNRQAWEYCKVDAFSLPYPACFFVSQFMSSHIGNYGQRTYNVMYCTEEVDPYRLVVTGFQFAENVGFYQAPLSALFDKECAFEAATDMIKHNALALDGELMERAEQRCNAMMEMVLQSSMIIEQKTTVRNYVPPTKLVQSVNAGRARGKLTPLGSVIRIEIDREIRNYMSWRTHGIGKPKSGSNVRSHLRHYQSGKVTRVKAFTRKGGKPGQSIYEVR